MEQFVFLLIFAVIGFINWLVQKSAEKREAARRAPGTPPPPSPWQAPRPVATPADDLGEMARRLRDALGLPPDAETPKPVARREEPPMLPEAPAAPTGPVILFERKLRDYEQDLERRIVVEPAPVPVARPMTRPPVAPEPRRPGPLDELLRSRDGLRKAIVLQEVLGTPKGLVF